MSEHPEYQTPIILPDNPLRSTEKVYFHFNDFAATLARLIANKKTQTPLTIGINGSWGTGKTTLLRRLQSQLDKTRAFLDQTCASALELDFINQGNDEIPEQIYRVCRTVWFNAWKYADEDELLVALVRVIVQEMFRDDFVSKLGAAFWEPFTPRRDVIDTVLGWFSIKTPFGDIKPNKGKPQTTQLAAKSPLLDQFDETFDHLMAAWVHHKTDVKEINPEKGVMVVFIDDLDRCLPAKTIQVLEAIKLFMDKEGCVFVLGADVELIQQAVETHYKDIKGQQADDYLEKIIQLRFRLPQIGRDDMQIYLQEQDVNAAMRSRWQALVAAAEANPRRVKAVVNDLELQWHMLVNSCQAEGVNRDDFICWQALMRAAPANFREEFFGIPEDPGGLKLRHQFITDALLWQCGGDEQKAALRSAYDKYQGRESRRLRDVLREIGTFSADFTPEALNAHVHLIAPPQKLPTDKLVGETALGAPESIEVNKSRGKAYTEGIESVRHEWGGIEFCHIPAGDFVVGSTDDNPLATDDEKPRHTVSIAYDYELARFPVTNALFQAFTQANPTFKTTAEQAGSAYVLVSKEWKVIKGADWQHPHGPKSNLKEKDNHPVVCISWLDAVAYCRWLNETYSKELPTGWQFRLPTEAEWEKASRDARGSHEWPWGSEEPDTNRCNFNMNVGDTTPVGQYSPQGDSPYGCADMAGNVWEWTHTAWESYPYQAGDGREEEDNTRSRVLRGGSFNVIHWLVRCAFRHSNLPDLRGGNGGFRVVASPISVL
ncbi:MAG: SUMF1/EgtB/PvdO family nonheme iron enzyme [Anaerolineales bacterium]|nr:SUMF1/EgtB/PvdO family nonheme iron enzyme [Anaerolineales bacterium]